MMSPFLASVEFDPYVVDLFNYCAFVHVLVRDALLTSDIPLGII